MFRQSETHSSVGRYSDALDLGTTASQWLAARLNDDDPAALSLYGMLQLRTAVAAGRRQDRSTAVELLARASNAAQRLGRDANYWTTGFGPTNVELHRFSIALDLGDVVYVVEQGPAVRVDGAPVERRVSHLIDLSRALSMVARDEDALSNLLSAEREAPRVSSAQSRCAGDGQSDASASALLRQAGPRRCSVSLSGAGQSSERRLNAIHRNRLFRCRRGRTRQGTSGDAGARQGMEGRSDPHSHRRDVVRDEWRARTN